MVELFNKSISLNEKATEALITSEVFRYTQETTDVFPGYFKGLLPTVVATGGINFLGVKSMHFSYYEVCSLYTRKRWVLGPVFPAKGGSSCKCWETDP